MIVMSYVPLNIKTANSLLSSMIQIPALVKMAKENGLKALTITDPNLYGAIDFYKECVKNEIKPIIGLEVLVNKCKLVLYCQNYHGYKNLMKLATLQSEQELTLEALAHYSEDNLCIMPYESQSLYNELNKIYQNLFIGYKNEDEKKRIKNTNKVYMNEILCLTEADEQYLKYMFAIRDGVLVSEALNIKAKASLFPLAKADDANGKIYDLCHLKLEFHQDLMPIYQVGIDSYELLKKQCIAGLKRIFGVEVNKKYAIRLKYELDIIKKMGFCDYFLIVADYIKYAKENGILVGPGRGSAAGSLVAYLLNITTIDPLKYDLLFERFLNPERVTMPDIDVDFEDNRRDEVKNYCIEKYGLKKVALIITFGTLKSRQVIRDVGRVLDIASKKIETLCKMMDVRLSLTENYRLKNIKEFIDNNEDLKLVYKIALKFEGLKRHTSIHAAGVVMSKDDLDEWIPLDKSHGDFYTTGYDMDYLEEIGLLKMDFLGLKNLTLINNILKEIPQLSFDTIPENDAAALKIFTDVNTVGIFQFESDGMMNFLRKFRPTTFEDVASALALFRPGPMQNIDSYIGRKRGKEKIDYLHPDLESILKPTYGIMIYQEQIMQVANVLAGYTLAEADILRRAMSKKKESVLLNEKEKFIRQSVKRGYSQDLATKVYNLILKFADYGFNRSHSVAYAMISYRMAYLKAHYPKLFMKHLLSLAINSETKTRDYIYECKLNEIKVSKPDINKSMDSYIMDGEEIIFPFTNIKNVGIGAVKVILAERQNGLFKDIFDFVRRCYGKAVNIKTLENLILAGVFDAFGINRKTLMTNLEVITNYGEIGELLDDEMFKPQLSMQAEYTQVELMNFELEVFGFYLSNHPVTEYKLKYPSVELRYLNDYFDKIVATVVYAEKIRVIETKRKDKMMFITGADEIAKVDIVLFPKVYQQNMDIEEGDVLLVKGRVEKRFDKFQIVANTIQKLK